jgi:hypothetical protein
VESVQGLHLRGWELDSEACKVLSELKALRVLRLQCGISPKEQLALSLAGMSNSLRWLSLQGTATQLVGLPNLSLHLQASCGGSGMHVKATSRLHLTQAMGMC